MPAQRQMENFKTGKSWGRTLYPPGRDESRFVVLATLICAPARVGAQPYPNRIIKLVVPFPAGGGADVLARIVTRSISEDLGQSFLIQNQPGAGGAIAFEQVTRAVPDGYTLVWTSAGFAVMSATLTNLAFKI